MRRADGTDNDFSGALTDRRQRTQLGSARLAAIVHALVNLLDRLAYQYTVNCPAKLAMIVRLPAGGGALVRRADTEEMIRIRVQPPRTITILIHRLAVGYRLS